MALDPKDIELLERLMYKNSDDVAVAISRSFERLEERIDLLRDDLDSLCGVLEPKAARLDLVA